MRGRLANLCAAISPRRPASTPTSPPRQRSRPAWVAARCSVATAGSRLLVLSPDLCSTGGRSAAARRRHSRVYAGGLFAVPRRPNPSTKDSSQSKSITSPITVAASRQHGRELATHPAAGTCRSQAWTDLNPTSAPAPAPTRHGTPQSPTARYHGRASCPGARPPAPAPPPR